ncbi:type VI secretion protein [Klebsiella pneumoniae]|uniref:Type VI secretion protein n=1 Tax=Klebsiella pneumoniae TaxID=573 RepID=A0A377V789_KLEPN|nr:type VI secretion protein [Klebsiella pneumoniae]
MGRRIRYRRLLEDETLSLSLTGTNGQLPRKALQSTVLDTPSTPRSIHCGCATCARRRSPVYPPARDRFHWRVLSHLGSNFLSMMDNAEILRGTLALYDWTESEMNRRRLEAIVDVQHHLIQRFEKGFLLRGVDIQVTLDSNGFAGEGDITPVWRTAAPLFRPVCRHPLIYSVDADSATYRKMFAMDRTPQPARTGLTERLAPDINRINFYRFLPAS